MASDPTELSNSNVQPFSFTEEEEPPRDTQTLRWRDDPKETYSDWTIQILSRESLAIPEIIEDEHEAEPGSLVSYHVHKYILACGIRKSLYFANLFQNGQNGHFSETRTSTSLLELDLLAASAFPIMLDFLYEQEKPLMIHTESAVPLHYLGEYLDIRHLRWDAIQFCKKDISLANVDSYYNQAMVFHSETVLGIIAKFLGENILNVTTESNILMVSAPRLWINALEFSPKTNDASVHISKLMAKFVERKPDTMDLETLHALTRQDFMPKVDPDSALAMCALEDLFEDNQSPPQKEISSSLQERCADSLAGSWQSLIAPHGSTRKDLLERKPSFLVDLLLKCLAEAQNALLTMQAELKKFKPITSSNFTITGKAPVAAALLKQNPCLGPSAMTILIDDRQFFGGGSTLPTGCCPAFIYQP